MSREITNKLYDMVDQGLLSWEQIAQAALCYMSEDDVADMAHSNEFLVEEDDYEDDGQPSEHDEWMSFDPDC